MLRVVLTSDKLCVIAEYPAEKIQLKEMLSMSIAEDVIRSVSVGTKEVIFVFRED